MKGKSWDRVGSRFADRYDLLGVLGSGGMGSVYKAKHAFTGSPVALKILHAGVARSASARERFLREAQAPTSIGHPGIVKVSDAGVADDGTLYLALELLDGVDLATAIERGNVDGAAAVSVCIDLLDCLGAAHTTGLVHRDIKPENIFLCSSQSEGMRVRLLDFGITRSVKDTEADKLTQTGSVLGTPHYMSPEQARGQPVDPRSDLYSVGGMLFYALTGRPAFVADNYNLLIVAIVTNPAPPIRSVRSEVPADVAAVIDRAMAANPADRFQSAQEMREALLACAPVSLPPVSIAPSIALEPTMLSDGGLQGSAFDTGRSVETPQSRPPSARIAPTVATSPSGSMQPASLLSSAGVTPSNAGGETRSNRGFLWLVAAIGLLSIVAGGAVTYALLPRDGTERTQENAGTVDSHQLDPPPVQLPPDPPAPRGPAMAEATATGEQQAAASEDVAATSVDPEEAEAARRRKERRIAARNEKLRREKQRQAAEAESRNVYCRAACRTEQASCLQQTGGMGTGSTICLNAYRHCTARCN